MSIPSILIAGPSGCCQDLSSARSFRAEPRSHPKHERVPAPLALCCGQSNPNPVLLTIYIFSLTFSLPPFDLGL
jgi:hypothetical protein